MSELSRELLAVADRLEKCAKKADAVKGHLARLEVRVPMHPDRPFRRIVITRSDRS